MIDLIKRDRTRVIGGGNLIMKLILQKFGLVFINILLYLKEIQ